MTAEDRTYLDEVVRKEQGKLFNFIRSRVGDEEDARDILQDVLYQLSAGFDDIRSLSRLTSWLFTVARNRITDYFRKNKTDLFSDKVIVSQDPEGDHVMLEDILPALTRSPEDEYMRSVIWETIEDCLDQLPEAQRDVFIMSEFEDMSFKEISDITGEGINTLLSRKRYAVTYLREQLKDLYKQAKTEWI
ncbi:MAG: sigma-70 family RNA polymerase sigma factor [Bacteroidales bacterium]|nr:sigma-70 family RNA polymerase sigma factor [Bacteroidales bacterium]